ncbi:hypothetical protein [Frankia sp. CiP3]|uniref:TRAFAC clade GTPase domain-containing protein n=1 Tax=Frankia sp. CiP3 TaxID=2880971 RepID=UPI001EF6D4A6|nr:hypothetical protein [Frankia sp. CiP3]
MLILNIVLIGESGSGKTTLETTSSEILRKGFGMFSARYLNFVESRFQLQAAAEIREGRYPNATRTAMSRHLQLSHSGTEIMDFRYTDPRGGSFFEHSAIPEAAALKKAILLGDAFIVTADASRLAKGTNSTEIRRVLSMLRLGLGERTRRRTGLVIALTKTDLVDWNDLGAKKRILAPFQPLIEAASANPHLHGIVVPTVCGPEPVNAAVPALWVLHHGAEAIAERDRATAAEARRLARIERAKENLLDLLVSRLITGTPTRAETNAERHAASAATADHNSVTATRHARDLRSHIPSSLFTF